jgi:hypothetical protein
MIIGIKRNFFISFYFQNLCIKFFIARKITGLNLQPVGDAKVMMFKYTHSNETLKR